MCCMKTSMLHITTASICSVSAVGQVVATCNDRQTNYSIGNLHARYSAEGNLRWCSLCDTHFKYLWRRLPLRSQARTTASCLFVQYTIIRDQRVMCDQLMQTRNYQSDAVYKASVNVAMRAFEC
eukprot:16227-Heterococcus_DN1.PRE.1